MSLARPSFRPRHALCALAATFAVLLAWAAPSQAASACTTSNSRGCLEVTDAPDPVVPSNDAGTPAYLTLTTRASNAGGNTLTHVNVTEQLPAGTSFVSVTTSRGQCSQASGTVTCSLGQMPPGSSAVIRVVVQAPSQEGGITTSATLGFAERANDNPSNGGKVDTVTVSEATTVSSSAGQTYVPANTPVSVATDPSDATSADNPQYARAAIPSHPTDLIASLREVLSGGPSFSCLFGQVTVQGTVYVCRSGNWMQAQIPGTFTPWLEFTLIWDKSRASALQSRDNFRLFYAASASAPIEVIGQCASATETRCFTVEETAGSWIARLRKPDNGYMR